MDVAQACTVAQALRARAARPARGTERGDAASATMGLATCAQQRIRPVARRARSRSPAAASRVRVCAPHADR